MTQVEHEAVRLTAFSHGAGCACKLSPADLRTVLGLVRGLGDAPRTPTSSSASTPPTTPRSTGSATTSPSSSPPTSSRRSSTTPTTGVGSRRPTRSPTCTRWAARRSSRSTSSPGHARACRSSCSPRARRRRTTSCAPPAAIIGGGHSIDDAEPKFGLAVVGTVDPARVLTNRDARAGDVLVLTKPIGLGVISTALKRDAAPQALRRRGDPGHDDAQRVGARRGPRTRRRRGACGHRRHRLRTARTPPRGPRRIGSRRRRRRRRGSGDRRRARPPGRRAWWRAGRNAITRSSANRSTGTGFPSTSNCCSPTRRRRAGCSSRSRPTRSTTLVRELETRGTLAAAIVGRTPRRNPRCDPGALTIRGSRASRARLRAADAA